MKKIYLFITFLFFTKLFCQIYVPNGAVQSSANNNVGIGTQNSTQRLTVSGDFGYGSGVATPANHSNAILRLKSNNLGNGESIDFGVNIQPSYGWIQAGDLNSGVPYTLLLNPLGGNVGIFTDNPTAKLDVRGTISTPEIAFRNNGVDDSDPYRLRKVQGSPNNNWLELQLNDDGDESFRIYGNSCAGFGCGEYSQNLYHSFDASGNVYHKGNVGIGQFNPQYKLDVNGTAHAREVKVDMNGWSDFVFKKDYQLPTLNEVEKHIADKGHLPGIPSEKEVLENGISLGEMNKKLLHKIEEMTLYIIEQDKKMEKMQLEIKDLKTKK